MNIPNTKYDNAINTVPLYAGSIDYYSFLLNSQNIKFDIDAPFNKMWALNRCKILGANGIQMLSIPLSKPTMGNRTPIKDIIISEHGNWEHIHWGAIFSAYGKAPFFEYIEHDLRHIFENHSRWIIDFNMAIHQLIVDYMQLPLSSSTNLSNTIDVPSILYERDLDNQNTSPYYQIWNERFGFVPGLSILDLMMNEGPHGILSLLKNGVEGSHS